MLHACALILGWFVRLWRRVVSGNVIDGGHSELFLVHFKFLLKSSRNVNSRRVNYSLSSHPYMLNAL